MSPHTVHVNFYGMPWNTSTSKPVDYVDNENPGGSSFLIGSTTIGGGVQPFTGDSDTPNYTLATTTFDTTSWARSSILVPEAAWPTFGAIGQTPGVPGQAGHYKKPL